MQNPASVRVDYSYDELNRLKTASTPLDTVTVYDYDAYGLVSEITGADGTLTQYTQAACHSPTHWPTTTSTGSNP